MERLPFCNRIFVCTKLLWCKEFIHTLVFVHKWVYAKCWHVVFSHGMLKACIPSIGHYPIAGDITRVTSDYITIVRVSICRPVVLPRPRVDHVIANARKSRASPPPIRSPGLKTLAALRPPEIICERPHRRIESVCGGKSCLRAIFKRQRSEGEGIFILYFTTYFEV